MKIGFDISQTGKLKAGCGYFADTLIRTLAEQNPDQQYLLYSAFGDRFWDPDHARSTCRIASPNCQRWLDQVKREEAIALWQHPRDLTAVGNPDIVHANNFSCPDLKQARVVYTLYDLSFLDYPEFTSEENRWICFNGVFDASLYADMIVAISEYSRQRFLEVFPHFDRSRTRVVHLGSRFADPGPESAVAGLTPGDFWLCVGTLEPRKNLRRTLRAYQAHCAQDDRAKPLVLAGGQGWLEEDLDQFIASLGLTQRVRKLGYVDDATLRWLYGHCWAFVYPSLYEGFGLPVLEAMGLGAAVITSNTTSLPEVGGEAVLMVDPTDQAALTAAFAQLMESELRANLQARSQHRARTFSWATTAQQVQQIYQETLALPDRLFNR
jgi:glycosyltransferase involved in cell wall biosynthesis